MSSRSFLRAVPYCAVLLVGSALASCQQRGNSARIAAGEESRGRLLLEQYDCGSCHDIPGVRRAQGVLGPTLAQYARRSYIAGEVPNQPEVLVRWIRKPSALVADTLMPDQGVQDSHARDMSAYLMSLR